MFYKFEYFFCNFFAVTFIFQIFLAFLISSGYLRGIYDFLGVFLTFLKFWKPYKMQDGGGISTMKASSLCLTMTSFHVTDLKQNIYVLTWYPIIFTVTT